MWSIPSSLWAVTCFEWNVTSSKHATHTLCGLLHHLCDILQSFFMHRRYVAYCVFFVGYCSLCMACYRNRVGFFILYACCTCVMLDVTVAVWAVTCYVWAVIDFTFAVQALCGMSLAKTGNENRKRRQGTKTGNVEKEPIHRTKTRNQ